MTFPHRRQRRRPRTTAGPSSAIQAGGYTPIALAFSVCQKMSAISSMWATGCSPTAGSMDFFASPAWWVAFQKQLVQVGELREVLRCEEVGPAP